VTTTQERMDVGHMSFAIRPMVEGDIEQVTGIERDAFPTLFPLTSFRRELKNRLASYLVVWHGEYLLEHESGVRSEPGSLCDNDNRSFMGRLLAGTRLFRPKGGLTSTNSQQRIAGFLGTWYMTDEAHIVSVGVKTEYRGYGIGELLIIGAVEQAIARSARVVTLEVRVSNHVARNLYAKYGFEEKGLRKAYYTNDREDAVIMTTNPLCLPSYATSFRKLVRAHQERWGHAERLLSP